MHCRRRTLIRRQRIAGPPAQRDFENVGNHATSYYMERLESAQDNIRREFAPRISWVEIMVNFYLGYAETRDGTQQLARKAACLDFEPQSVGVLRRWNVCLVCGLQV